MTRCGLGNWRFFSFALLFQLWDLPNHVLASIYPGLCLWNIVIWSWHWPHSPNLVPRLTVCGIKTAFFVRCLMTHRANLPFYVRWLPHCAILLECIISMPSEVVEIWMFRDIYWEKETFMRACHKFIYLSCFILTVNTKALNWTVVLIYNSWRVEFCSSKRKVCF